VSGDQGVDAAVLGRAATVPADPATPPACPAEGPVDGREPGTQDRTDAPPTANPLLGRR
jgi:hypothetical protein